MQRAEASTVKSRDIQGWDRQRELHDLPEETDDRTMMPRRAASAARGFAATERSTMGVTGASRRTSRKGRASARNNLKLMP
jgi:hypothetical protein